MYAVYMLITLVDGAPVAAGVYWAVWSAFLD